MIEMKHLLRKKVCGLSSAKNIMLPFFFFFPPNLKRDEIQLLKYNPGAT